MLGVAIERARLSHYTLCLTREPACAGLKASCGVDVGVKSIEACFNGQLERSLTYVGQDALLNSCDGKSCRGERNLRESSRMVTIDIEFGLSILKVSLSLLPLS